jgi:hypothetical protein
MPVTPISDLDHITQLKFQIGTNWNGNNITTLLSWISISAYNIECLELSIDECRTVLRRNTIFALFTATLAGTLNITQFNIIPNEYINIVIKILFTFLTFAVAINAGRIKIYQYQENMEDYIKVKQEWTAFVVIIATEMQLPINLRRDALYLIETYKEKYLDLLKYECEISKHIKEKIKLKMKNDIESGLIAKESNLHPALMSKTGIKIYDIVFDIAYWEGLNLMIAEKDKNYKPNIDINPIYDKITTKILEKKKITNQTQTENKYFNLSIIPNSSNKKSNLFHKNKPNIINLRNSFDLHNISSNDKKLNIDNISVATIDTPLPKTPSFINPSDNIVTLPNQSDNIQNSNILSSNYENILSSVYNSNPISTPTKSSNIKLQKIVTKILSPNKEKKNLNIPIGCRIRTLEDN